MDTIMVGLVISVVILSGITLFLKLIPKEKAIAAAKRHAAILGPFISGFGNTKVGKKIWSPIEEGPITTGCAYLATLFNHLPDKITEDNKE